MDGAINTGPMDSKSPMSKTSVLSFVGWIKDRAELPCDNCKLDMQCDKEKHPMCGRCGHAICGECVAAHVVMGLERPSQFMPCPVGGCTSSHVQHSFGRALEPHRYTASATQKIREANKKLKDMKRGCLDSFRKLRIHYDLQYGQRIRELQEMLDAERLRVTELEERLEESGSETTNLRELVKELQADTVRHTESFPNKKKRVIMSLSMQEDGPEGL